MIELLVALAAVAVVLLVIIRGSRRAAARRTPPLPAFHDPDQTRLAQWLEDPQGRTIEDLIDVDRPADDKGRPTR